MAVTISLIGAILHFDSHIVSVNKLGKSALTVVSNPAELIKYMCRGGNSSMYAADHEAMVYLISVSRRRSHSDSPACFAEQETALPTATSACLWD